MGIVVYCIWSVTQMPQSISHPAVGWPLVLLFFGGVGVIGLLSFVLWIWTLVECLSKEPSEGNTKLIWTLVIVFLHIIGSLLYVFVRRPERIAQTGR